MYQIDRPFLSKLVAALILIAGLAFSLFPSIDLAFSGLYFTAGQGFPVRNMAWVEQFRNAIWDVVDAMFVVALAGLVAVLVLKRQVLGQGPRQWGFVVLLYLLGPILMANGVFKSYWGRARPFDVMDFGGTDKFTPFWLPTDQCVKNCSFVSGEVSGTMALALAMLALAPGFSRYLGQTGSWIWTRSAVLLPVLVACQRLLAGAHFLSDVTFAALFTLAIALAILPVLTGGRRA